MSTGKYIDRICAVVIAICVIVAFLFMNGEALGIEASETVLGYETRLFDTSKVHTINIEMDDWEGFIENCESEEYSVCSVTIDGETYSNVGIRGKGNTSLSNVSSMDSSRYSFKIEFDQYDSTKSYHGLDKLSLNNIIQDNTYMKDYLTYQMMNAFGTAAPLCSYVYITVNGEDWGLYLAVEGVEDSFLQRNYGTDYGELYKPDSLSFGGGRGNGRDFDMDDFMESFGSEDSESGSSGETAMPDEGFGGFGGEMPEEMTPPDMSGFGEDFSGEIPSDFSEGFSGEVPEGFSGGFGGEIPEDFSDGFGGEMPEGFDPSAFFGEAEGEEGKGNFGNFGDMMENFGGMGSDDVKLKYIDDDPESYSNIFDSAKTDITSADKNRLIDSLEILSTGENIESVVDVDSVLKYFVVHNYVVNGDSYTGSMVHNYYLYEEDGRLSMIPWDYNLAFGTFGGEATSAVNDPIDSPLSVSGGGDRPMADWIFQNEEYTELYHQYYAEFLETVDIQGIIENAEALIAPYVEKDPTKFCTYEEFEKGVETLKEFCSLRSESVEKQLSGEIGSTDETQEGETLVDASGISLSDMGSMSMGGGKGSFGGENFDRNSGGRGENPGTAQDKSTNNSEPSSSKSKNETESAAPPEFSSGGGSSENTNISEGTALIAASIVILIIGIIIAFRFRR